MGHLGIYRQSSLYPPPTFRTWCGIGKRCGPEWIPKTHSARQAIVIILHRHAQPHPSEMILPQVHLFFRLRFLSITLWFTPTRFA